MEGTEQLKGTECANAWCADLVPGEGYFCRRYHTWAGICPKSHEESMDGEQRNNAGSAAALFVQG